MIIERETEDAFIVDFSDYDDWDGFNKIMSKLRKEFNARVLEEYDGPDARVWYIDIDGFTLTLHNNPYGNYLKANNPGSIEYLKNKINLYKIAFY